MTDVPGPARAPARRGPPLQLLFYQDPRRRRRLGARQGDRRTSLDDDMPSLDAFWPKSRAGRAATAEDWRTVPAHQPLPWEKRSDPIRPVIQAWNKSSPRHDVKRPAGGGFQGWR